MKKPTLKTYAVIALMGTLLLIMLFPGGYLAGQNAAKAAVKHQLQAVRETGKELLTPDLSEFGLPSHRPNQARQTS